MTLMHLRKTAACLLLAGLGATGARAGTPPAWWAERNVVDTNLPARDFAPVTQGQVKWLATNACAELEAKLPGGAGAEAQALVAGFATSNACAPVNLGQLKNVLDPICARLVEEGVVAGYPWTREDDTDDRDWALVNIGQAKQAFSFTLEGFAFTPSVNGAVGYAGPQTGRVWVVASPADGAGYDAAASMAGTGRYHLVTGRSETNWAVASWRDSNANGLRDTWEAQGRYAFNPVLVTTVVAGVDLQLDDPDEDGDGIAGYRERDLGLDPDYAQDADSDADGDGLSLAGELRAGSDPHRADTDGDGMGDGAEVLNGLDPATAGNAAGVPFEETFEAPALALGDVHGQHGWIASRSGVARVQTNMVIAGQQSLVLVGVTGTPDAVSQPLASHGLERVWIDFMARPAWRLSSAGPECATWSGCAFYVNRDGRLVVRDGAWQPASWVVLTNAPALVAGQSARFTVLLDYARRRWGLWVNGTNAVAGLSFAGHGTELARLRFTSASATNAVVDDIRVTTNAPAGFVADFDGDGLPDDWEMAYGLDPTNPSDRAGDLDCDGLTALEEYAAGTNPYNPDSDGDGVVDGAEVARGTDPLQADPPAVAAVPFMETFEAPAVFQGDVAGQNGWQATLTNWGIVQSNDVREGTQALWLLPGQAATGVLSHAVLGTNGATVWTDLYAKPARRRVMTPPALAADHASAFHVNAEGYPVVVSGARWLVLTNAPVLVETNWCRFTVMQDFARQAWSLYVEGRPVATNLAFARRLTQYTGPRLTGARLATNAFDAIRITAESPGDIDADGDGLPNAWEAAHGLDSTDSSDPSGDLDRDGLTALEEYAGGTNPRNPDTDGDGLCDGVELLRGYSPTNTGLYAALPFTEPFEPPTVTNGALAGQHGWVVATNPAAATVQTGVVFAGAQALQFGGVTSAASAYLPLGDAGSTIVWTDWRAQPVRRTVPGEPVLEAASAVGLYINGDGLPVVADGFGWVTLTNATPLSSNDWTRFTTCQDYDSQTWALYIAGTRVATNLAFAHPVPRYSGFMAKAPGFSPAWLDSLVVSNAPPLDIDLDGDGMPGDWEAAHGLDPADPADWSGDLDQDGLSNADEHRLGCNPCVPDTDGDGIGDGAEAGIACDPAQSNAFPRLPFLETFEPPAVSEGSLAGQNGWTVEGVSGVAVVQTNAVFEGQQALALARTGSVAQAVAAQGCGTVWIDLWTKPVLRRVEEPPAVHSNAASAFYVNSTGLVVVCSGSAGTQAWQAARQAGPVSTAEWARITVCQDYAARVWSLWLNGVRVAADLGFANPVSEFSRLGFQTPLFTTGQVDSVSVGANEPAGLDDDGDGLPNDWERAHGLDPSDPSDPSADHDRDGLTDLAEYAAGTDPLDPDTDGDGLVDGHDGVMPMGLFPNGVDRDGDGFAEGETDYGCDPLVADTDGDGLGDGAEVAAGLEPAHSTLGEGLVAWYRMDETNGLTVCDSSANGLHGQWQGSAAPTGTVGRLGSALEFDGVANGVQVEAAPALNLSTNLTLAAWVRPAASGTGEVQVVAAREGAYCLVLRGRRPEFTFMGLVPFTLAATSPVPAAAWTHLGVSVSGTNAALYVDGRLVVSASIEGTSAVTGAPLGLGFHASVTNGWWSGALDDIRLYGRVLAPAEIQELQALGADDDGDTRGARDELEAGSDPSQGGLAAAVRGDLDGDGRVTPRDRDRLVALAGAMRRDVTRFVYDEEGNLIGKTDTLGNATTMTYNRNNRLLARTDANGGVAANTMDVSGAVIATTDALGNMSWFEYNRFGNVTRATDALGNVTTMEYNRLGQVTRTVSPSGIAQETVYDDLHRVRAVTVGAGLAEAQTTWTFYDVADNLVSNRNTLGIVNEFQYDARNLTVRSVMAKGTAAEAVEESFHDARGLETGHKDARGFWSSADYDALGRAVSATDALGNVTRTEYDNLGRAVAVVQPNGRTVRTDYDKWGRAIRLRDGGDAFTTEYDALDRVVAKTDWRGIRSEFAYDAVGSITASVSAVGTPEWSRAVTMHDALNRPVRTVNANTQAVTVAYDALGNRAAQTNELGLVTRWLYRHGKRLEALVKPDGTVVSNVYDALDRVVAVRVNGALQQSFAYDALSRMTAAVDFNGTGTADDSSVTYEYDALNRVVRETQNGQVVQREYDAGGNATRLTTPSGFAVGRDYDANGRLAALRDGAGTLTYAAYEYTPNSRVQRIAYGSGVVETHGYDARERLHALGQENAHCSFQYTLARDANGNVTHYSESAGEGGVLLYDAINRVTARKNLADAFQENLRYDALGNWLSYSNGAQGQVTRDINAGNQYTRIGVAALRYDLNGSLTNWVNRDFAYDHLARLVEVRSNGAVVVRYGYDAQNRRVSKELIGTGARHAYFYDGENLVEEAVNGAWTRQFVYGTTIDTPVAAVSGGSTVYYLRDWRANVAAITDAGGVPVETYRYSLFGQMQVFNAVGAPVARSGIGNIWTFAARQWDEESGLMHNRNRAYSAELGRFLQYDPAGYADGMNLYAYAGNNPLLFSDPYGLYRWSHGALEGGVGDWIFQQYGQLREIERQRREYEEAVRQAQEAAERAKERFCRFKVEHAREIEKMVKDNRYLGLTTDEAAKYYYSSGTTKFPRLGASWGPDHERRQWFVDYYLRGGGLSDKMRAEMRSLGYKDVDKYFAYTEEHETKKKMDRLKEGSKWGQVIHTIGVAASGYLNKYGGAGYVVAAIGDYIYVRVEAHRYGLSTGGTLKTFGVTYASDAISMYLGGYTQGGDSLLQSVYSGARTGALSSLISGALNKMVYHDREWSDILKQTAISAAVGGAMGAVSFYEEAKFGSAKGAAKAGGTGARERSWNDYGRDFAMKYANASLENGLAGAFNKAVYGGNIAAGFGQGVYSGFDDSVLRRSATVAGTMPQTYRFAADVADLAVDSATLMVGGVKDLALSLATSPVVAVERAGFALAGGINDAVQWFRKSQPPVDRDFGLKAWSTLPDYVWKHLQVPCEVGFTQRWESYRRVGLLASFAYLGQELPTVGNFVPGPVGNMAGDESVANSGGINADSWKEATLREGRTARQMADGGVTLKQILTPYDRGTATEVLLGSFAGYKARGLEWARQIVGKVPSNSSLRSVGHSGGVIRSSLGSNYIAAYGIGVTRQFSEQGPALGYFNNIGSMKAVYSVGGRDPTSDLGALLSPLYWSRSRSVERPLSNDAHRQGGDGSPWDALRVLYIGR